MGARGTAQLQYYTLSCVCGGVGGCDCHRQRGLETDRIFPRVQVGEKQPGSHSLKKKIELKLGMKCSVKNAAGWSLKIAKGLCVIHTPRFFVRCVILGSFFFFYISTIGSVCVFMFGRAGRRVLILAEQSAQEGGR